jgi:hypothetical protein
MSIKGYITGAKVTDHRPRVLGYAWRCDECNLGMDFEDVRGRDMMAGLHQQAYEHDVIRARLVEELWSPFNPEGYVDDERLAAEGWHSLGTMKEGEGPVMLR